MSYLIMSNIAGLILIGNPVIINFAIILITITTPLFHIDENKNITIHDNWLDKSLWMILYTFVLLYIFLYNNNFTCLHCTQSDIVKGLVILALLFPYAMYVIHEKWLEYRLFSLVLVIIIDFFIYIK